MGKEPDNKRVTEAAIDKLFINRWSPRALDPSPIPQETLRTLFEAARWSPSCFNEQPWLFMYADTPELHTTYLEILAEGNRVWCKNAPVLAILFARRRFTHNNKPNSWAVFDCGAAWMSLTVQARLLGLYTHGMAGFSKESAYRLLGVPQEDYEAVCAIAIGRYGDPDTLPADLREREEPNGRNPLATVAQRGIFKV